MFEKKYSVSKDHIDFQGVVDGLYYPFYMEWARHEYMKEFIGIDIKQDAIDGKFHMILGYSINFRKSLKEGDEMVVTCSVSNSEKKNRINFNQEIKVNGNVFADAVFVATCLVNGRPSVPDALKKQLS